ncbi:hypothetical protein U9M48_015651 [Paspalum notatum var. saurae]|uniref:Secreted protein n=1 Tax=Paspalum notatum var. saurae TaxID=547442 RepID=A0AAQ3T4M8_PASNO
MLPASASFLLPTFPNATPVPVLLVALALALALGSPPRPPHFVLFSPPACFWSLQRCRYVLNHGEEERGLLPHCCRCCSLVSTLHPVIPSPNRLLLAAAACCWFSISPGKVEHACIRQGGIWDIARNRKDEIVMDQFQGCFGLRRNQAPESKCRN